jgi:hypothetical protein
VGADSRWIVVYVHQNPHFPLARLHRRFTNRDGFESRYVDVTLHMAQMLKVGMPVEITRDGKLAPCLLEPLVKLKDGVPL